MEEIRLQGRVLSIDDVAFLRALIAQHADWNRTALSRHLCQLWNWRNGAGRLKDMAARTLLLKLQARGLIELPPAQSRNARPCAQAPLILQSDLPLLTPAPIHGRLNSLRPVSLELVETIQSRRQVAQLLATYHYRGFHGAVGDYAQLPIMRN
jgi:hypothetical protein